MALTYEQRYDLLRSAALQQRVNVAVWIRALEVLGNGASTAEQKQEARARLKRPLTDLEARIALIRLAASPDADPAMTDDALQTVVSAAYAQLPAP